MTRQRALGFTAGLTVFVLAGLGLMVQKATHDAVAEAASSAARSQPGLTTAPSPLLSALSQDSLTGPSVSVDAAAAAAAAGVLPPAPTTAAAAPAPAASVGGMASNAGVQPAQAPDPRLAAPSQPAVQSVSDDLGRGRGRGGDDDPSGSSGSGRRGSGHD